MSEFILSLFPGAGLLDRAFEEMGDCVVRSPDKLWGGDIKAFHPPAGKFDGVIGGAPCKPFSKLRHMIEHNHKREPDKYHLAENLIPEYERCVIEAQPMWWLMENVPDAPDPVISGYFQHVFLLNNRWVENTTPQNRNRKFWFGHRSCEVDPIPHLRIALFEPLEWDYAVTASGSGGGTGVPVRMNSGGKRKKAADTSAPRSVDDYRRLQGLPDDFLTESPFTVAGLKTMIGNGVPLPMGRAVAEAIHVALVRMGWGGAS